MRTIFVTGIGTDVGKTVVSAVLTQALQADYWKPIQTGCDLDSDTDKVKKLVTCAHTYFHPEKYLLKASLAPLVAAKAENISIDIEDLTLPETSNNTLVIEGAGGLMVPVTENFYMIDLIERWRAQTVLVVQNYLGSINHTLLSIEALKNRDIAVLGIIMCGVENPASEEIIFKQSGYKLLGRINKEPSITAEMIKKYEPVFSTI